MSGGNHPPERRFGSCICSSRATTSLIKKNSTPTSLFSFPLFFFSRSLQVRASSSSSSSKAASVAAPAPNTSRRNALSSLLLAAAAVVAVAAPAPASAAGVGGVGRTTELSKSRDARKAAMKAKAEAIREKKVGYSQ